VCLANKELLLRIDRVRRNLASGRNVLRPYEEKNIIALVATPGHFVANNVTNDFSCLVTQKTLNA
jgi:hypothetical protein